MHNFCLRIQPHCMERSPCTHDPGDLGYTPTARARARTGPAVPLCRCSLYRQVSGGESGVLTQFSINKLFARKEGAQT